MANVKTVMKGLKEHVEKKHNLFQDYGVNVNPGSFESGGCIGGPRADKELMTHHKEVVEKMKKDKEEARARAEALMRGEKPKKNGLSNLLTEQKKRSDDLVKDLKKTVPKKKEVVVTKERLRLKGTGKGEPILNSKELVRLRDEEEIQKFIKANYGDEDKVVIASERGKGEALKFDEDDLDEPKPKVKKPKVRAENKEVVVKTKAKGLTSNVMEMIRKAKEQVKETGKGSYFTKYGTPAKGRTVAQIIREIKEAKVAPYKDNSGTLIKDATGAIGVEYREGYGLMVITGTRPYNKGKDGEPCYWHQRGIVLTKDIISKQQLIFAMTEGKMCFMEVRGGVARLLPNTFFNKKTGRMERRSCWIDIKGRSQNAYGATAGSVVFVKTPDKKAKKGKK